MYVCLRNVNILPIQAIHQRTTIKSDHPTGRLLPMIKTTPDCRLEPIALAGPQAKAWSLEQVGPTPNPTWSHSKGRTPPGQLQSAICVE